MSFEKVTSFFRSMSAIRQLLAVMLLAGLLLAPTGPAAAETCAAIRPLPFGRPLEVTADGPVRFAVDVATPGLLVVVEAHGTAREAPRVRWLDEACRPAAGALPVRPIGGRLVQRVATSGSYVVEVTAADRFRLIAWSVAGGGGAVGVAKREPMDESDELQAVSPQPLTEDPPLPPDDPSREPMDESDELRSGGAIRWREVAGHGLLERTPADGLGVTFHPWCPRLDRPELLATFTCARQLHWQQGVATFRPLLPEAGETFAFTLASPARVTVEPEVAGALFDVRGERVAELGDGGPVPLPAGEYFLRIRAPAELDSLQLVAERD